MSDRRKAGAKNRTMAYIAAGVAHLLLIGALLFNFTSNEPVEKVDAFDAEKIDTVKASLIDESQIKDQQEKLKKADRERERKKREKKKREQDELDKIKQQTDQEKKKIADLKAQQKLEKEKAEQQRKAIELKKKKEEEQRKKDAAAAKKKEDAEKKRVADLKKQLEQEEEDIRERQRINKLLAEEEAERQRQEADRRAKERTTTVVSKFFSGIKRKIEQKRTVDPAFETWRKSVVDIKLSPSGEVLSVRTIESSGLVRYDQSVESAIYAASPFEMPDQAQDANAVSRLQNIELEVKHPSARR